MGFKSNEVYSELEARERLEALMHLLHMVEAHEDGTDCKNELCNSEEDEAVDLSGITRVGKVSMLVDEVLDALLTGDMHISDASELKALLEVSAFLDDYLEE